MLLPAVLPCSQALLLHNSVIKHAVYQNVGWVVEQEGDSFSVVFHEAEDAVAFTLQVRAWRKADMNMITACVYAHSQVQKAMTACTLQGIDA
jgi:hypothetical protein